MPKYYFDFRNGEHSHSDVVGIELPHQKAAEDHMRRALIEVFRDFSTAQHSELHVQVRDRKGHVASGRLRLELSPVDNATKPSV